MLKLYHIMKSPLAIPSYLLQILVISQTVIRNVLFGLDDHRMAKETMATMNSRPDRLRDDMSLVVVEIL